jgi:hypothetical protein
MNLFNKSRMNFKIKRQNRPLLWSYNNYNLQFSTNSLPRWGTQSRMGRPVSSKDESMIPSSRGAACFFLSHLEMHPKSFMIKFLLVTCCIPGSSDLGFISIYF